jgi:hypothetical protein
MKNKFNLGYMEKRTAILDFSLFIKGAGKVKGEAGVCYTVLV